MAERPRRDVRRLTWDLLEASRRRHRTPDLRERALARIAEVDRKMADLAAIRDALTRVVAARCDSLTHCTCPDCPLPVADPAGDPL